MMRDRATARPAKRLRWAIPLDGAVRQAAPIRARKVYVRDWGSSPLAVAMASSRAKAIARNLAGANDMHKGWSPDWRTDDQPNVAQGKINQSQERVKCP